MDRLDASDFEKARLARGGVWIVAFIADWCPFCQSFLPQFSTLEAETGFRAAIGDLTSEESPHWDDFRIEVVPTVAVFRDGRVVFRVDGILGTGLPPGGLERARASALAAGA